MSNSAKKRCNRCKTPIPDSSDKYCSKCILTNKDKQEISSQVDEIAKALKEENLEIKIIGSGESVKRNIDKHLDKSKAYEVTIKEIVAPF